MKEWKEYILSEIATIVDCEHKTAPLVETSEYISVRTSNIANGKIDFDSANRVSLETYEEWTKRKKPTEGDIVLAREAPVGEVGWIPKDRKVCLGQRTVLITVNDKEIDPKYLLYYFANRDTKYDLVSRATGSVVEHLNVKDIKNFELKLHANKEEQTAIATVLSSLDEKIDLLHRQNKTLEGLAEVVFREWFVEGVESSWESVKIGDVAKINHRTVSKNYPHKEIEYLDTGSITRGNISGFQTFNLEDAPSRAQRIVEDNDIVYSLVRPIQRHYGILHDLKPNTVASTGFCVITCDKISPYFIYVYLTLNETVDFLDMVAEGSTSAYPSLKPSDIADFEFQMPPKEKLSEFASFANDAWNKIKTNTQQIRTLTGVRDTVLPKVMSGEIRVKSEK